MNRSELVAALSERAEVTRKDADAILSAFAETVGEVVAKGDEKVTIPGFSPSSAPTGLRAPRATRRPVTRSRSRPGTASRCRRAPSSRKRRRASKPRPSHHQAQGGPSHREGPPFRFPRPRTPLLRAPACRSRARGTP
ncbi:HU family DNA-binding protein [Streptomyces albus]